MKKKVEDKVFLNCDKTLRSVAKFLRLPDKEIYHRGILSFAQERAYELSELQLDNIIQAERAAMMASQERIAFYERVRMDAGIREEQRKRDRTHTMRLQTGEEIMVVDAE